MGRPKLIDDDKLLGIARAVFIRDGAAGSTREIAERAGISESALFKRFTTKAGLFLAAMAPPRREPGTIVAAARGVADPRQALFAVTDALLAYFRALIPVMLPLVQNPLIGPETIRHHFGGSAFDSLVHEVTAYLASERGAGRIAVDADPNAAAALLVACTHSVAQFEVMGLHPGAVPPAGVHALVDALWRGLAPPTTTPPKAPRP